MKSSRNRAFAAIFSATFAGVLTCLVSGIQVPCAGAEPPPQAASPSAETSSSPAESAEAEPSPAGVEFFEKHVRPLLAARCYSCHAARTGTREGDLTLDTRAGWRAGGSQGPAIVPGDVDASLLIRAVRYADPDLQMPPDKQLAADEIARLEQWVKMGAPDSRDGHGEAAPVAARPSDPVAGRSHWAFRPLREAQPPDVRAGDWPQSAIDQFVLAGLERNGLAAPTLADRRTRLRRLYFQLIGLPPSPEDVAAFLADERPDAWERQVDRLLESPQFGERWGRHWLDLARFADSNGLDENFLFREAWRYRNWVIDAVNADMPYDRFLLEQLAGDLLPHDSVPERDRQRIAAGFLVVGPKVLLGNDPRKQRMEVADEQIDTIGRAVLGQTLGCARCHDHKFDPVPTADYYALAGILTSTEVMEQRYMLGQQRVMERLVGLGAEGDQADAAYEAYWRQRPQIQQRRDRAAEALKLLEGGKADELAALSEKHPDAIAPGAAASDAADTGRSADERLAAQRALVAELDAQLANPPAIPPRAMIPCDQDAPADEAIRLAGQFDKTGEVVRRGFLRVLSDEPAEIPPEQSGRLQLARWLTDVDGGAGHLAARVLANRVWHHLIGRGLVRTVDNFGRTGEEPSHPELLDYLATQLIQSDWSMKSLVRRIVMSRTFSASSRHDAAAHALDPENRWLWRANRQRLEPEALRDAMLAAAGQLDLTPRDSTVWYLGDQATAVGDNKVRRRTDFPCRSVYLPVIRNDLPELFDVFNFADPHRTTGMRPRTIVATQGLYLLNADEVMAAAQQIARRLGVPAPADVAEGEKSAAESFVSASGGESIETRRDRVDRLYELLFSTTPAPEDRDELVAFVRDVETEFREQGAADATLRAWTMACQALLASSRFQILE